ncbi:MAG: hypothetical protein MK135_07920 [Polyangiaceae bacterium]|nr:hypothetical protein [Polyangiaceae bacterium]
MDKLRPLISLILVTLTVLSLRNVYSDHSTVEALAARTACEQCKAKITRMQSTPIALTYRFQTTGARLQEVRCQKEFIFLGQYSCDRVEGQF